MPRVAGAVPSILLSAVACAIFPVVAVITPTVSFCRHGYRIDVQGAQDSVSGLEYGRILSQMRGGSAACEHGSRVSTRLSPRLKYVKAPPAQRNIYMCANRTPTYPHRVCRGCQDVEAAAVASKRLRSRGARERDAEKAKQAAVLNHVPEGDVFSRWAETEDALSRDQWQPLR